LRIEVKGRNVAVDEQLREHVTRRFRKVARQVSELAELEVEVFEERNPAIAEAHVAEATLHLKGVTLRARCASRDLLHSVNEVSEEIAVQVKRHRDKRRKRREARSAAAGAVTEIAVAPPPGAPEVAPVAGEADRDRSPAEQAPAPLSGDIGTAA
jgi:putative sigma-54 modulation protein